MSAAGLPSLVQRFFTQRLFEQQGSEFTHGGELPRHVPVASGFRHAALWTCALKIVDGRARRVLHGAIPSTP